MFAGVAQIYFDENIVWTKGDNCSVNAVVVRNKDTHIMSAILAARMSSTPIRLYADDSLILSGLCYLRVESCQYINTTRKLTVDSNSSKIITHIISKL